MKRILSSLLTFALIIGCCACRKSDASDSETTKPDTKTTSETTTQTTTEATTETTIETDNNNSGDSQASASSSDPASTDPSDGTDPVKGPLELNLLVISERKEIDPSNEIQDLITEKTGVLLHENFLLPDQSAAEEVQKMLITNQLPDLIDADSYAYDLYADGKLLAWDTYLDDPKYANLRNFHTDKEWEALRQDDGHIYWCNSQNVYYNGQTASRVHNGLAFWIQVRVLEWAGYPKVETLDDYFKLLEDFYAEHPVNEDGIPVIPFTTIVEDWRYGAMETIPPMLEGKPFEGSLIVNKTDPANPKVETFDLSETAKRYYKKLNEEYNKGIVDPEFHKHNVDQYVDKIRSGAVLGLSDFWWDFSAMANDAFRSYGYDKLGYDYVPLGLTIDPGMTNQWDSDLTASYSEGYFSESGIAVTKSCKHPDAAFAFMNRLLDEDIHDLRYWGIEGIDYEINEDGLYTRTDSMMLMWKNPAYLSSHVCEYDYLPHYWGYKKDGRNPFHPEDSESYFFYGKSEAFIKCCKAYDCKSYRDFLHSEPYQPEPWLPLYNYYNFITDVAIIQKMQDMISLKHQYLPELVVSKDFESTWKEFKKEYQEIDPEIYLTYMQEIVDEAIANAG